MSLFRPTHTDKTTGERKESTISWCEFIYDGQRIRQSAKSTRKTVAEAQADHRKRLEQRRAGMPAESPRQRIRTVATVLNEYRAPYSTGHRSKSVAWVKERTAHVERILGNVVLVDSDGGDHTRIPGATPDWMTTEVFDILATIPRGCLYHQGTLRR